MHRILTLFNILVETRILSNIAVAENTITVTGKEKI